MNRNNQATTPDIRELILQMSQARRDIAGVQQYAQQIDTNVRSLLVTRSNTPAAPVANILWNGEIGHSVNSWHDTAYTTDDKSKEAAWWFSHNKPAGPKTFTTISVANQIPITGHGFTTGSTVDLLTTGTLPTGLSTGTVYYVIRIDDDIISLASTKANAFAGTALPITIATGSGTHTIQERLIATDARTSSTNYTLKKADHTTYDARYSRWNSLNGWAELTGTMTVDQLLPSNAIDATTPLARVSLIAARKNRNIEIPDGCLIAAGIWDNTDGQRKFLEGDIGFAATLVGTPGTVERRYRILITSDRGFELLSPEITIANGPSDAQFSTSRNIAMSWQQQAGQLQVDIYEYLPAGGDGVSAPEYRILTQISAATSYIHLGTFLPKTISGYPTATGTVRNATFFTADGEIENLPVNAVSPSWATINFPIGVPNNYNKGNTTERQWLRIWLTEAPNLFVTGCTTDGSTTITAASAAFDSEYDAEFDAGNLVAEVYDSDDVLLATTTVASRTDDTNLVLGTTIPAGTNRKIRIVGAGFHGVYLDKIHLGFQLNTSYAPNALDSRFLQPVAAPSSGSQGGVGTGGTGGGVSTCVIPETPIKQADGTWQPIVYANPFDVWAAGGVKNNVLASLRYGFDYVRRVRTANGCEVTCTDTERFTAGRDDEHGTPLYLLRVGDTVLTEIDGRIEESAITEIGPKSRAKFQVVTPSLTGSHHFIAGHRRPSHLEFIWSLLTRRNWKRGGFVLHNNKPLDDPGGGSLPEPPPES